MLPTDAQAPAMKRLTESDLIAKFDWWGNSKRFWKRHARELLAASSALMESWEEAIQYDPPDPIEALDYHGPSIMLRAMAFECLLKARALNRGMVLARDGRYVKISGVRDHDLVGLAKAVAFEISRREERVLRRLSRWITAGRYPIQRHWTEQTRLTPKGMAELLCAGWDPGWDEVWGARGTPLRH